MDIKDTNSKLATSGEIKQQTSYYPFGLEIKGSNEYNREKYNRKERITELDLGWYDYGARMYDPFIGRWSVVDPMAQMRVEWTPYNAMRCNLFLKENAHRLRETHCNQSTQ